MYIEDHIATRSRHTFVYFGAGSPLSDSLWTHPLSTLSLTHTHTHYTHTHAHPDPAVWCTLVLLLLCLQVLQGTTGPWVWLGFPVSKGSCVSSCAGARRRRARFNSTGLPLARISPRAPKNSGPPLLGAAAVHCWVSCNAEKDWKKKHNLLQHHHRCNTH